MAAIGVDGNGDKHVLAVVEGATENTVVVQALIDNLLARGLDPTLPRLFIVDGAKALSKAIRNTFGVAAAIQRFQVHKGRNIIERLPQHLHASVKKALRQAWDQDDANKAGRFLRNLVRRLEHEEPGVSGSILEGLDEILTVIRLGLPHELRRSLACTNIAENALGTVRQEAMSRAVLNLRVAISRRSESTNSTKHRRPDCCSASVLNPFQFNKNNRLPCLSASNLRAEQQLPQFIPKAPTSDTPSILPILLYFPF